MPSPPPLTLLRPSPFNLPNALSAVRIVAIPGVVILLYRQPDDVWRNFWAAALFGLAFFTDLFDGWIARRTHTITRLGKILDPMADKLLVLGAIIMLVHLDRLNVVVAILLLGREVAVSGLRSLAGTEGILIPSRWSGKIKTFMEGFGLGFLCLGPNSKWLHIPWYEFGHVLTLVGLALALWSGSLYFRDYYRGLLPPERP